MGTPPSGSHDLRRIALNERLRRLKASAVALTIAGALCVWWLVGGTVAATQARSVQAAPQSRDPFFAQQQPSLGVGSAQLPSLSSGGS